MPGIHSGDIVIGETSGRFERADSRLIILTPLGLLIPAHFNAGGAWGEWDTGEIHKIVGYVPKGMEKLSSLWNAPMPDYSFKGWDEKGMARLSFAT